MTGTPVPSSKLPGAMHRPSRRYAILVTLALVGLLAALAAYWSVLLASQRSQQREIEAQTWLRVSRMALAASVQVRTLLSGLDYTLQTLGAAYAARDAAAFDAAVHAVREAYPDGAVLQVAVADASGGIAYSSLDEAGAPRARVSILDREHFQVHARQQAAGMYVSRPVRGRVSQRWSIQLSRALWRDGVFAGVLVLSLSPDYIAQYFDALAVGTGEEVVLLRSDGYYLARSQRQDAVLGTAIPADRAAFFRTDEDSGRYVTDSQVDGLRRMYAWHRVPGLPLIASAGLERSPVLAPGEAEFTRVVARNALGTAAILTTALLAAWLTLQRERSDRRRRLLEERFAQLAQQALARSEERLRSTLHAVRDGLWEWDCTSGKVVWDGRCAEILGYPAEAMALDMERFLDMVHPADRTLVRTAFQGHVGNGQEFRVEMRLRTAAGGWHSVESRGDATQRDAQGQPLQMRGTHTDIQQRVEQVQLIGALLDRGSALVLMATPQGDIAYANERAARSFGLPVGAQPGGERISLQSLQADAQGAQRFADLRATLREQGSARDEARLRLADGSLRWFDLQGSLLDAQDGDGRVVWTLVDVDARRRAESALEHARRTLAAIVDRFPVGVLVADAQGRSIVAANQQAQELLRLDGAPLAGLDLQEFAAGLVPPLGEALLRREGSAFAAGSSVQQLADGRHLEIEAFALLDQGRRLGHCWVISDATERRQRESRLETLALTDALTGVPNRRAFMERLDTEMQHLHAGLVEHAALLMLDIDHFKRVNDTWGHAAGDVVLRELAQTVARALRSQDMVGRIGGEEFAVLLSGAAARATLQRAEELRLAVADRAIGLPEGAALNITISLGVAGLRADDASGATALERADAAMYHSKRNGRNRSTLWSADLPQAAAPEEAGAGR
ncbi:diguanylate cyclase [Melaminivora suipulveris]|nr:diguanylate cyclase [Melaminivora suipulveris]